MNYSYSQIFSQHLQNRGKKRKKLMNGNWYLDGHTINLDNRPLKTPQKAVLLIPTAKPLLAHGIAVEWANLRTTSDALKSHRIPLTQMASRAVDLGIAEAAGDILMRGDIMQNLIRYIDTDTILCWAPATPAHLREPGGRSTLRELQIATCDPLLEYLGVRVWPAIDLRITDGDRGIFGLGGGQPTQTKDKLMTWMKSLDVWRLVGLERIVHATKSFVIGARMVAEWSEGGGEIWGVKEAAEAASIEVTYQTRQWGEVEDTHDVQKEDLLRQVGAGWLLICGEVDA
jgi:ATP synthase F1 complex assembly factor 2